jgi:cysteine desulfurase/selenocysteine lyase
MTTTNSDGNFEHLAGVPSAAELTLLANQLFPDLTEGVNATGTGAEAADVRETEQAAYGASAETAAGSLPSGVSTFNWEDPFAYGNGVPGVSGVSLVPGISGNSGSEEAVSYAPKVISAEQAKEQESRQKQNASNENTIVSGSRSESESSVRIGTKTLAQIREDFPILAEQINGHPLVWLDNGATTQRPQQVIDRIAHYYRYENSNVHRGAHTLAARSTDAYENARRIVKDFIGASSAQEIVFVRGTTEGINLVANSFVLPQLKPGDEIIVSILEHHANIVPWQLIAQKTGAVIKVIPCDSTGQLILSEYEKLFTAKTRFVSVTHVSNVLGTVTPVEELIAIAHRHGVRILIDGAQSVAHIPVNVSAWDADFFVFSGHKIYAPTGIGVVYGKKELLQAAEPYHGGGNMIADVTFERTIYNDVPNKFEAGTGSIADAVGLGAALEYLSDIGMPCVYRREHELIQYGLKELKKVPGLTLVGTAANKSSALAFKLAGHSDDEVGRRLDSYGIAVRTGHHCAQPVLRHFGYESTVRPTLGIYNSESDIDALVRALRTFG